MKVIIKIGLLWCCQGLLLPNAGAQLTFSGTETQANTTTAKAQQAAAAAMDAGGNFALTWESFDQDGSGYGIYAQRFDNTGSPLGGEFLVNSATAQDQRFPAIEMDPLGNFVIVWQSYGTDGDGWGIYARRYDDTGTAQGSAFQVNTTTAGQQRFPKVGIDGSGNFTAVWESEFEIKAQRYDNAGTAQGGELTINTTTAGAQNYPDVTINGGGDAVVVWQSHGQDGDGFGIFAQRFDNAGIAQGGEMAVNTTTANNQLSPRAGMDALGNFVVVWVSNVQDGSQEGVYGQRFDNAGIAQGGEFAVNTTTAGAQDNPDVAVAADGAFLVCWNSYGQDGAFFGVYAQAFVYTGAVSGSETAVNTTTAHFQQFAALAAFDDSAVITWQDGDRNTSTSSDGSDYGVIFRLGEIPCNPPVAQCTNYTLQIETGGSANLDAADVDGGSTAECLPLSLAVSPNTFDCGDIGMHTVTLTVTDDAGQTSACTATVTVQDNGNFCDVVISGAILWEHDGTSGVSNTTVALSGDDTDSDLTPIDGTYSLTASNGSNFTVTPGKTLNKLNGITVGDALAIQQHVTQINPITNPYKQVAADVNKSNSISTFDATVINQALLGNPAALAQFKTSWRFVPVDYSMSSPPWGFPEKISLTGVSGNVPGQDFYGIKTGDVVDIYANPANLVPNPPLVLRTKDQNLEAGQELTVMFQADAFEDLAAWQFALRFDPERLQLQNIQPLDYLPLAADNFGMYNVASGEIRSVWSQERGFRIDESIPVCRMDFKVLQSGGRLSDALWLDEEQLPAFAYTSNLRESGVELRFSEVTGASAPLAKDDWRLLQNRPNPFTDETTIGFVLPQDGGCNAQLRIFDVRGRELWRLDKYYAAGYHAERVRLDDLSASGVLWYELTTPYGTQTKRMVRVGR